MVIGRGNTKFLNDSKTVKILSILNRIKGERRYDSSVSDTLVEKREGKKNSSFVQRMKIKAQMKSVIPAF